MRYATVTNDESGTTPVTDTLKQNLLPAGGMGIVMSLASSPYGFKIDGTSDTPLRHSNQVVSLPIADGAGQTLGTVVLSDGPAAGQELVDNVLRGWAVAGAVAVLLAGAAGWLVSRQMTRPLLALTGATQRMAQGDLSARAAVRAGDEFGQLAGSFNDMATRVEETVQTLRHFVADAAHELHTPLTALRTNLELATDDQHPGQQASLIAEALKAGGAAGDDHQRLARSFAPGGPHRRSHTGGPERAGERAGRPLRLAGRASRPSVGGRAGS